MRSQSLFGFLKTGGGIPTPDLLWNKFPDGSGSTSTSAVGPNLTLTGSPTWVSGPPNGITLDGVTQVMSTAATINPAGKLITVMAWINATWNTGGSGKCYWSNGYYSSNTITFINSTNEFDAYVNDNVGNTNQYRFALNPSNGNRHIAIVYDNTDGSVRTYIDGAAQTPTRYTNTWTTTANLATGTLYFGAEAITTDPAPGTFKDIRVYSGEVSAANILAIYNAGAQ